VMIAVALGARVVAVDVTDAALSRATTLGATEAIHARSGADLVTAISNVTDGGAHVSIDALGDPAIVVASIRSLRRRGRHVQLGLLPTRSRATIPMERIISHELEVYGSHGMAAHDYPAMLAMVMAGTLRPDRLVGSVINLDGVPDAMAAMDLSSPSGMTVIVP
jgi:D-arabinose 1-dehydrogenase-like Zn-dependent alcohol dehydrogenase